MSKFVSEMCNKKYEQNHVMVYIKLLWISLDLIKIVHYFLEVLDHKGKLYSKLYRSIFKELSTHV